MTQRLAVEVTALAAQHIRRAEHWWRSNRPSVPNAVREDLEQALSLLATQPRIGPIARNVKLPGVRRVYLARIKYDLYYREIEESDILQVLALWHSRRGAPPPI
jgi:plasmid stabilization system protein ParE